ncbi:hypothetical protein [Pulveribacter sp.]|uniref:hypothetical protein n=1 Tax=Pulveribacter sp. TaxID=2678893 RepID=UPI0028A5FBFB|nr:hypothetical protein [Pulveribacter sp.]
MSITLSSVEDAIAYLERLESGVQPDDITFEGELQWLRIRVEGERYHATVPGELARGIWQFQEAVYSAAAYALTGVGDIRKLTADQRSALELVFEVKDGSSDFWAALSGFLNKIAEGCANMDPVTKARLLIVIALIVAGGYGFGKAVDVFGDVRKEEIKAQQVLGLEQQQTRQMEIFTEALAGNKVAQKFDEAVTEGTKAIARSAPDATEIDVGRTKLDAERIEELNRRAPRVQTVPDVLDTSFRIFKVDVREPGVAKYVLAGDGTGEFVATLNEANFSQADLTRVLEAAQKREQIRLEVLIARSKGEIRSAQIMQVSEPEVQLPPLPRLQP